MVINLLDSVRGLLSNDLVSKAAANVGENEVGVSKAFTAIIPSILGGIVAKGASGIDGASSLLDMTKSVSGGVLGNLGDLFGVGGNKTVTAGTDMAGRLLGTKTSAVVTTVSKFSGIKEASVSSLMGMVTPVALALLGKHISDNKLSAATLSGELAAQKNPLIAALPAGLGALAGLAGLSAVGTVPQPSPPGSNSTHAAPPSAPRKRRGWLVPFLLVMAAMIGGWLLLKGWNNSTNVPNMADTMTAPAPVAALPAMVNVKLPDGKSLDAFKGGIEDKLVAYLNSTNPADSVDHTLWFDFDNLNFKSGSAELTDSSMAQVQRIVAILKAFPRVSIKIGGYTDNSGPDSVNMVLSQERADAVLNALKLAGANPAQLTGAEGFGSQFAVVPSDAPDDQKKRDRRISINVRSK